MEKINCLSEPGEKMNTRDMENETELYVDLFLSRFEFLIKKRQRINEELALVKKKIRKLNK